MKLIEGARDLNAPGPINGAQMSDASDPHRFKLTQMVRTCTHETCNSGSALLRDELHQLLVSERINNRHFIDPVIDVDTYLNKLFTQADITACHSNGQCRGFVASYCNDMRSLNAYISLLVVSPDCRGTGIGRALVGHVCATARTKGFLRCRLEVRRGNAAAFAFYRHLGFVATEERCDSILMEATL